jgi:hypothetical protein
MYAREAKSSRHPYINMFNIRLYIDYCLVSAHEKKSNKAIGNASVFFRNVHGRAQTDDNRS